MFNYRAILGEEINRKQMKDVDTQNPKPFHDVSKDIAALQHLNLKIAQEFTLRYKYEAENCSDQFSELGRRMTIIHVKVRKILIIGRWLLEGTS